MTIVIGRVRISATGLTTALMMPSRTAVPSSQAPLSNLRPLTSVDATHRPSATSNALTRNLFTGATSIVGGPA